jgi:SAM-dependent methyltransferase
MSNMTELLMSVPGRAYPLPSAGAGAIAARRDKRVGSILVGIASYGTAQDHHLQRVVAEYRKLAIPCRIVVLSDRPKNVNGAEVKVGLPTRDPYSLPFAHRELFAANVDDFDLFIYSEDDTLITRDHIRSFVTLQGCLSDDEILGFIRSEVSPSGEKFITSVHRHFRWLPETIEERAGELFAEFSNRHSGCFMVEQQQLKRALASGGFLVKPHAERYGMLESAASDIYTQCGLRRLMCVTRLEQFTVAHLANKYYHHTGIPIEELSVQAEAIRELHRHGRWTGSLFDAQSRAPGFRWSKNLYEEPDDAVLSAVPASARRVLSIGAALGRTERRLVERGVEVCAVPLDGVFDVALRRRGICTSLGPLPQAMEAFGAKRFDVILMTDVLHLVADPTSWLSAARRVLSPEGWVVARVDNTADPLAWLGDVRDGRRRPLRPGFAADGVQPTSVARVRRWCAESGLVAAEVRPVLDGGSRQRVRRILGDYFQHRLADKFIIRARVA